MIAYRHVWRRRSHRRWLGHAAELVAAGDETEGALAEAERQKMIEDIAIKDIIMHDRRHPSPPSWQIEACIDSLRILVSTLTAEECSELFERIYRLIGRPPRR